MYNDMYEEVLIKEDHMVSISPDTAMVAIRQLETTALPRGSQTPAATLYRVFKEFTAANTYAPPNMPQIQARAFYVRQEDIEKVANRYIHAISTASAHLIENDQSLFTRFQQQLEIVEQVAEKDVSATAASVSQSSASPSEAERIQKIKDSTLKWQSPSLYIPTLIPTGMSLGAAAFTAGMAGAMALAFGIAFPPGAIVMISILLIGAGIGGIVLLVEAIQRYRAQKAYQNADSIEKLAPLFDKMSKQAQAKFFVELDPRFREEVCKRFDKGFFRGELRFLGDVIDTLKEEKYTDEMKRAAIQSLCDFTAKNPVAHFKDELLQVLKEDKLLAGVIVP